MFMVSFISGLNDIASRFTTLLGGGSGSDSVAGIDIGSSSVKVVEVQKKGGTASLLTYGALALGPYGNVDVGRAVKLPTDTLIQAIGDLLREAHVNTKDCAMTIPLSASLLTYAEMPDVGPKKLATMIPIEARKYIPVPISEVALDWIIMPQDETGPTPSGLGGDSGSISGATNASKKKVDVLLVAIHNETIEQYGTIASALGLNVKFVEIEIFSTARAVLDKGIAPMMVLDMGASSTKLYLVEHGMVRSSHTVPRGSQDITTAFADAVQIPVGQAEEIKRRDGLRHEIDGRSVAELIPTQLDYIFSEANRVLLNYQRKYNKVVSRIVLSGGGALLPGFIDAARERFDTEVVRSDPFSKINTPAYLSDMLLEAGPEFSAAVGVTLRALQEN